MITPGLTVEEKLLLSLCRMDFTEYQKSEIRQLISEISDWNHFVKLANDHGIIALVWHNINQTVKSDRVPKEINTTLHSAYIKSLAWNTYLYKNLSDILELTGKENIKVVLLKGIALEKTVYGDIGLRQMNDIDILVKKENVLRLRDILINNGFRSLPLKSPLYKYLILDIGKHIPSLIKDDCSVEIHHNLFGNQSISSTQTLISQTVPVKIDDHEAFIPSPQLSFLYLVSHLGYHDIYEGSQLRMYADLVILLDSNFDEIINKGVISFASEGKLENQLAGKLYLLSQYWGITYPEWLTDFIRHYDHSFQTKKFLSFLHNPKGNPPDEMDSDYSGQLSSIPGLLKKLLYITGFLLPSIKFMKRRYNLGNNVKAVFYYPVRWIRMVWKIIGNMVKRHKGTTV